MCVGGWRLESSPEVARALSLCVRTAGPALFGGDPGPPGRDLAEAQIELISRLSSPVILPAPLRYLEAHLAQVFAPTLPLLH